MFRYSKGLAGVVATYTRLGEARDRKEQLVYCGYGINIIKTRR